MSDFPEPKTMTAQYTAATSPERRSLLLEWLPRTANTLAGIAPICNLAYLDPLCLLLALKTEIQRNPANITALRALIWWCIRFELDGEAAATFSLLRTTWPQHGDAVIERMRCLMVNKTGDSQEFMEANKRYFAFDTALNAYATQSLFASGSTLFAKFVPTFKIGCGAVVNSFLSNPDNRLKFLSDFERVEVAMRKLVGSESVAIVGSGPSLRGMQRGKEIDACSTVVRCNFPAITGYEGDVGARTDLLLFSESMSNKAALLVERHQSFHTAIKLSVHSQAAIPVAEQQINSDLLAIGRLPYTLQKAISDISYSRATTGLSAVILVALLAGKKPKLFGFDFFENIDDAHYYDKQIGVFLGHELQYERWFIRDFLSTVLAC